MAITLITAPAANPVDSATVKLHLRVIGTSEDALIDLYTNAAISALEKTIEGALITQTWDFYLDSFASERIDITLPPLQSVTSIKYLDANGAQQTLSNTRYTVDTASKPGGVVVDSDGWPVTYDTVNAVIIRFVAGFGSAADVPASLRSALLLHIGDLYENRQTGSERQVFNNPAYDLLTYPYRILSI